jgi:hypothetical protein
MPVSVAIANAAVTIVVSFAALSVSIFTLVDSHTTEQHQVTSRYASIKVDLPRLTTTDKAEDGDWSETVSGSGFNGDTLVNVYYPSAEDFEPQPSNGQASQDYRTCPFLEMPVLLSSGSFVAHVPILGKLPGGQDYIYVRGATSQQEVFAAIQIGDAPLPAPTSTPSLSC